MDEWKELATGKLVAKHDYGFTIIKPSDEYEHVSITCPVCNLMMRDNNDLVSFQRNECCRDCEVNWAEPHRDKWLDGWRPSAKELEEGTLK